MKLLYISNGYPPHRWAGTETYTAGLAEGLAKRSHQVQVLCAGQWQEGANYWNGYSDDVHHGVSVRRLNLNWARSPDPFTYLYNNPVIAGYLERFLAEIQPDVVHVTSCETLSASVLSVVNRLRIPLILSITDFWFLCPRITLLHADGSNCDGNTEAWDCLRCMMYHSKAYRLPSQVLPDTITAPLLTNISKQPILTRMRGLRGRAGNMAHRKEYLRKVINLPDVRITASPFVRDIFVNNGISAPIMVQPYGHDLSWLEFYKGKKPSEVLRIGYIGQIANFKGVHLLLQATNKLNQNYGGKFSLSIYGNLDHDPDYSSQLLNLSANQANVKFCGTYPHDLSASIFEEIDVLVVPSLWYDFPLIIYEAYATRTPVIASRLGGMAEAVGHGINGLLFTSGDVDELAQRLRSLLDAPELLTTLAAGISPVKRIADELDQLENIYRETINSIT